MELQDLHTKHQETVLITGGTGHVGSRLVPLLLAKNYKVIIFTRDAGQKSNTQNLRYAVWHPSEFAYDKEAIADADYIINLAGANLADKKWSEERKRAIYDSRINSDVTLINALAEVPNKVRAVVSASATGFYGQDHGKPFTESDPAGEGFLAAVCQDWERLIQHAKELEKRTVILRTGVVLDKKSGMHKELAGPLRFRIATVLGNGEQIISWVHIEDLCRAYIHAIENDALSGIYNASAAKPVSNEKLVTTMAKQKYGRGYLKIKVPAFALKLVFGQMAEEALLMSTTVSNKKLCDSGFEFQFNDIEAAIKDMRLQPRVS